MLSAAAATYDDDLFRHLATSLSGAGNVVRVDPSIEALKGFAMQHPVDLWLFDIDAADGFGATFPEALRLLRELDAEATIMVLGDESDSAAVLAAVRAGASNFVDRAASVDTMRSQLPTRARKRNGADSRLLGRMTVIAAGIPGSGENEAAINIAALAACAAAGKGGALLIDCNLPATECDIAFDVKLAYSIRDMLFDLSRLDRTLIDSTITRHEETGLYILPLSLGEADAEPVSAEEIASLVFILRGFFDHVVVNLGAMGPGLLERLAKAGANVLLLVRQYLPSVRACANLLNGAGIDGAARARINLGIVGNSADILLGAEQIGEALEVKSVHRLPAPHVLLANSVNAGRPIALEAPRSPYVAALRTLADLEGDGSLDRPGPRHGLRYLVGKVIPGIA